MEKINAIVILTILGALIVSGTVYADETASTTPPVIESITVNVSVREGSTIAFTGPVTLIKNSAETITDTTGASGTIGTDSAFAALRAADIASDAFLVNNTTYYPAYDSFLVNCINITNGSPTEACYAWQYVVNNTYPFVGSDDYKLNDGDTVYFYFGSPRRFSVGVTTAYIDEAVDVGAESYDYQNDIWTPLAGTLIGATQPDPSNPWSPLVPYSTTTDATGHALLTIGAIGSYDVGLAVDYYFPTKQLVILATTTAPIITVVPETNTGGGNHNNEEVIVKTFDVSKAGQYLSSKQDVTGAVGAGLYTDWAGIAFAVAGNFENEKSKITEYISSHPTSGNWLPDYERHAMALMALNINPRTGTNLDYISKIISNFDGVQFGDAGIYNDDIFALFPLIASGYTANDIEIEKAVEFIISKQSANGSWTGVDMTAAAIQVLSLVKNLPNVNDAISRARTYLAGSQLSDGGWGDVFATSWAMQAITALGESQATWIKNGKTPSDYLTSQQQIDGSIIAGDTNSSIWATSYAIPAALGRTWDSILNRFSKPVLSTSSVASISAGSSTTVIDSASSTPAVLGAFVGPDMSPAEMLKAILEYIFSKTGITGTTMILLSN